MGISNYDKLHQLNIQVKKQSGSEKTICPQCSHTRKRKNDPCLSVNITEGVYNCHNCGFKGGLFLLKRPQEKQYIKPIWNNNTSLSDGVVKWFKTRGIDQQTLIEAKVTEGLEWMPQDQKEMNCIKFNYFRNNELINTKFRTGAKGFKLVKDAELVLYNLDSLISYTDSVGAIITEGEIDCLSFMQSGLNHVLSVPNGASRNTNNLAYLDNCFEQLENIDKFYIAVDNDEAGLSLREELIRRLGSDKCLIVDFKDCKDANEYLQKYGSIELAQTITDAKECNIDGIIRANDLLNEYLDLFEKGLAKGDQIGLRDFDDLVSFVGGQLTTITGVPNHGKSDFLDQVNLCLALRHGWKFGIFSPENYPIILHLAKMAEKLIGRGFGNGDVKTQTMNESQAIQALNFIHEHFFFIDPKDDDLTLDNILHHAKKLVRKYGINGLIIDPWNKLDHSYDATETETKYISRALDQIIKFNQKNKVHTFLVAHPTKMPKDKGTGQIEIPNLYNINGSANFNNKTDNGIVVHRFFSEDPAQRRTEIHVLKVKYKHLGKQGVCVTSYEVTNGRYNWHGSAGHDFNNWLNKVETETNQTLQPNLTFLNDGNEDNQYPF